MGKASVKVTLNQVSSSQDKKNWEEGTESHFDIITMEQEGGITACVALEDGSTYSFKEIEFLYEQMKNVERSL